MTSFISLIPLLLAASTLTTRSLATPQITPRPYNSVATSASLAAASAAAAYSDNLAYSAAAASASAYYLTASGSVDAALPAATGPDACGPKVPDSSVTDTCNSFVEQVNSPHAYGVQCLNDGTKPQLNFTSCEELIPIMCSNEFQHAGQWVWASHEGCSLGSFLPPESLTGAAQWPPQANCEELIYGAMLLSCAYGSNKYNVAAVNLQTLPNNTPNGKGAAVNAGYPSYLIAEAQPRNQPDSADSQSAVEIDVAGQLAQQAAQVAAAYASESAMLATITGTAAAQALSDLNTYRTMGPVSV